ncbi:MAG: hypothetical protein R3Y09_05910 [Clostridia bacterium]
MKNRFIENYDKISEISVRNGVDLGVACIIFTQDTKMSNWSDEKEEFDQAYVKWYREDFKGEIADFI